MQRLLLRASVVVLFMTSIAALRVNAEDLLTPTKDHEGLATQVGVWDADISMWESPTAEPTKSKGSEKCEMLGKYWLMTEYEADFGQEKMKGRMALGYDPIRKKLIGGWVDTMSPFMMKMEGDFDPATKTATMIGESTDPMTGKSAKYKMVTKHDGPDAKTFTMYHQPGGDDKWVKFMEIKYTRKK